MLEEAFLLVPEAELKILKASREKNAWKKTLM